MYRRGAALALAACETLRGIEGAEESGITLNRLRVFTSVQFNDRGWWTHRRKGSATVVVSCAGNLWEVDCSRVNGVAALASDLEVIAAHEPGKGTLAMATAGTVGGYLSVRASLARTADAALRAVDDAVCVLSMESSRFPEGLEDLGRCLRAWPSPSRLYTAGVQICVLGNAEAGVIHHHFGTSGMPAATVDGMIFRRSEALLTTEGAHPDEDAAVGSMPRLLPLDLEAAAETDGPRHSHARPRAYLPVDNEHTATWHSGVFVRATAAKYQISLHSVLAIATQVAFLRLYGRFLFLDVAAREDGGFVAAPVCHKDIREFVEMTGKTLGLGDPLSGRTGTGEQLDLTTQASLLRRACHALEEEVRAIRDGQGVFEMIRRRLSPFFKSVCIGLLTLEPAIHEKIDVSDIGRRSGLVGFGPSMFGWPRRTRGRSAVL